MHARHGKSVPSFQHLGSKDHRWVTRHDGKCLYSLSHLTGLTSCTVNSQKRNAKWMLARIYSLSYLWQCLYQLRWAMSIGI